MTAWEPATEAEVAMRDALRANDQELYFRLLSRTDLLLPVAAPTQPGQPAAGWGTWTTGGRTHVLAFTSAAALRACLGDHPGSNRRVPFTDLAVGWPNHEWWLAVNPGLPVEGYLPAWFVAQLSRGDVRLPGRAMGARARLERVETLARTRTGPPGRDTAPAAGRPSGAGTSSPGSEPAPAAPAAPGRPAPVPPAPSPLAAVPPAAVPSAPVSPRRPSQGVSPRVAAPASGTPGTADPSRRPGEEDLPAAGQRHPTEPPRPGLPGTGALPRSARPSRFAPLTPVERPTTDQSRFGAGWPAADRPGDDGLTGGNGNGGPQAARRSFFEPTPVRDRAADPNASGGRPGDRAAPPTRFGLGSQPFPRRRPARRARRRDRDPRLPMADPDATRPPRQPVGDLGTSRGVRAPAPVRKSPSRCLPAGPTRRRRRSPAPSGRPVNPRRPGRRRGRARRRTRPRRSHATCRTGSPRWRRCRPRNRSPVRPHHAAASRPSSSRAPSSSPATSPTRSRPAARPALPEGPAPPRPPRHPSARRTPGRVCSSRRQPVPARPVRRRRPRAARHEPVHPASRRSGGGWRRERCPRRRPRRRSGRCRARRHRQPVGWRGQRGSDQRERHHRGRRWAAPAGRRTGGGRVRPGQHGRGGPARRRRLRQHRHVSFPPCCWPGSCCRPTRIAAGKPPRRCGLRLAYGTTRRRDVRGGLHVAGAPRRPLRGCYPSTRSG